MLTPTPREHRPSIRRAVRVACCAVAVLTSGWVVGGPPAAGQMAAPPFEEIATGLSVNGRYTPLVGRFTGLDNREDILWYAPGSGPESLWQATGTPSTPFTQVSVPMVNGSYVPVVGDFSADGFDDIIWYGPGSAPDTLWNFTPSGLVTRRLSISGTFTPVVIPNTTIPDAVFWYAPGTATDWLWTFAPGTAQQTSAPYVVNGTYRPFAGDFDQDTLGDLFWYAPGPAPDVRWMRTGTQAAASFTSATDPVSGTYVPIVGDFGTNGKFVAGTSDIAWTTTTGTDQIWDRQETSTHRSAATITAPKVVQVGRPGADALIGWGWTGGDIVWRSTTLGGDTSRRTDLAKVATDAIPVVGRFGDTDDESVLWYRPGAGAERYWTTYE